MGHDVLTLQEAAELLGKSTQTIRRMIKKGDLKAHRIKTAQGFQYGIYREQMQPSPSLSPIQGAGQAPIQVSSERANFEMGGQPVELQRQEQNQGLTSQVVIPRNPLVTRQDVEAFLENDFYVLEPQDVKPGGVELQQLIETHHREKMLLIHILEALQGELREERAKPKSFLAWLFKKIGF